MDSDSLLVLDLEGMESHLSRIELFVAEELTCAEPADEEYVCKAVPNVGIVWLV